MRRRAASFPAGLHKEMMRKALGMSERRRGNGVYVVAGAAARGARGSLRLAACAGCVSTRSPLHGRQGAQHPSPRIGVLAYAAKYKKP